MPAFRTNSSFVIRTHNLAPIRSIKKSARGWLSRVRVDIRTVGLEPNLGSDLQGSRIMPAVHRTERAIVDAGINRARAAMVEGIERLQPELQTCLFSEVDVLHQ